jgi:glutaconate CoA-transferase subunit B
VTAPAPDEPRFTIDEWVCAAMARTIRDGEIVFHGFASPCATVAMHVAKRTHATAMVLVEGSTYALDPEPAFIPPTSNDWSLVRGAAHLLRFEELFDLGARGGLDRMFLSGGQIDAHGNTNVTAIGPIARPKVKLGGGGGGCNLSATVGALSLWTGRHRSGRTLVEQCDFVTDVGHRTRDGSRQELGFAGAGPEWLVSELGVFDFADGRIRLRELYPDVTVEDVRAATGFELAVHPELRPVPPPDPAAVAVVRQLDPLGIRRREFAASELERTFDRADERVACAASR